MSNIDKQVLREAAERAESDSWGYDRDEFNEALTPSTVLALLDELEAKDKRIAELEAREVKLPNPHAHLIWIQAGHAPDDYWDDVAVSHSEKDKCCDGSDRYPVYTLWEIKEALSAIGINIAAAGKGE
ncbi:TPA: ead/Ea22-like family protein [Enterobacter cloacae]|uniref:ead/Ea22-like family protein n=1 Tax=Enterobacter roggenkampii TaxID=1812935 RepID=UPI00296C69F5|nr:ead/Ea22-like family protein [Enterobacter cloacae]HAS1444010.1 ead/Ea22-like family protein [Enterobacter cloacae]HAS1685359.1 ead/Ea22-like family protein [Enterobacter cloacae]